MSVLQFSDVSPKLSDCFALPHSCVIFVPSTMNVNEVADSSVIEQICNEVAILLSNRFGGGNFENVRRGFWNSSDYGLVIENCIPVHASFDVRNDETDSFIVSIAYAIKRTMNQESVYFAIDGKAYLV